MARLTVAGYGCATQLSCCGQRSLYEQRQIRTGHPPVRLHPSPPGDGLTDRGDGVKIAPKELRNPRWTRPRGRFRARPAGECPFQQPASRTSPPRISAAHRSPAGPPFEKSSAASSTCRRPLRRTRTRRPRSPSSPHVWTTRPHLPADRITPGYGGSPPLHAKNGYRESAPRQKTLANSATFSTSVPTCGIAGLSPRRLPLPPMKIRLRGRNGHSGRMKAQGPG